MAAKQRAKNQGLEFNLTIDDTPLLEVPFVAGEKLP